MRSNIHQVLEGDFLPFQRQFLLGDGSRLEEITDYAEIVARICSPTKKYLVALSSTEFALLPEPRSYCEMGMYGCFDFGTNY